MSLVLIAGQYPLFRMSVSDLINKGGRSLKVEEALTIGDFTSQQLARAKVVICCDHGNDAQEIQRISRLAWTHPNRIKVLFSDRLGRSHRHLLRTGELDLILPMSVDLSQAEYYLGRLLRYREPLLGLNALDDRKLVTHFLPDMTDLTRREKSVVHYLGKGLSNEGIAEEMAIHINTVKVHMARICKKAGVRNRTHAVIICRHLLASGF
ncbi:MAG: LuxR C-terminal-related transcriptional regulator [Motiliproteus sp.]|nr:LuxR C-terminal-related transcriptional regulator [Motiliproteus sp.]MCW9052087.1 LuxR C-terminal-related transcriptional regulator [Motiliproteus sp.]